MMTQWIEWLAENWLEVLIPVVAFLATSIVGIWVRTLLFRHLRNRKVDSGWKGNRLVLETTRRPFLHWFMLLGLFIAVQVSPLSATSAALAGRIIASLFVLSIAWVLMQIGVKLIRLYAVTARGMRPSSRVLISIYRLTLIILAGLVILDIWGAPVNPLLLLIIAVIIIAAFALRDVIPGYLFGIQLSSNKQLTVGDYVKLDSGESGEVAAINWQNTQIKTPEGHTVIIPNSRLARTTLINYGRPLKKASTPFHFYTRLHLRELTGLKASNLNELLAILKEAPDSVIYYHVHRFLEEHLYLSPEPANDFAIWVNTALGNDVLGEQLASIDTFSFPNLGTLKQRLVEVLEEHLKNNPDQRRCPEGEEFHFIRSTSFILPTPYVVHDLREFLEILRKVTIDSIYFHIYEARLRLQKGTNDFSIWIADSLEEKELGDAIAGIDPYVHTLESLRNRIIERVEKHLK